MVMAKGPQRQYRPADVVGCAVLCAKIATGEAEDTLRPKSRRRNSGIVGAKARTKKLTKEDRVRIAKKAAMARWG